MLHAARGMLEPFVFNPFVPGFDDDPAPTYHELRTHAPVYYWPLADAWLISRYHDILAMMKDPRLSRSQRDSHRYLPLPEIPEYAEYRAATIHGLFQVGQADHLRLRRLVNPAFTPRAIERLRADIHAITEQALAGLPDAEFIDLAPMIDDIPLRVIGRMLAIPADMEPGFLAFARTRLLLINPALTGDERDLLVRDLAPGYRDIRVLLAERRQRPGDDLLSTLIHLEEEGARLDEAELIGLVESIIIGGADTTVHTLRFMLLTGCRRSNALKARWEHMDLERRIWFMPMTKSGKPQYSPLSEECIALLSQLKSRQASPWVFPSPTDSTKPLRDPRKAFARVLAAAGIKGHVRLHDIRHTHAALAVSHAGQTLFTVQKLLHHASPQTTMIYSHMANSTLARVASTSSYQSWRHVTRQAWQSATLDG